MFEGKTAIVTGGARGIGAATAELLASGGARVVLSDVDADAARATAASIDGEVTVHAGDLTRDGEPEALVATAIDAFGRLDVVVNNAGYTRDAPLHKLDDDAFQAMLDIHTVVPFRVLRAAAPHLREPAKRERAEGREVMRKVVNVSSGAGTMGNAGQANYAAAKAGVVGLTKTLAKEWGRFSVNVNAVAFGLIETRLSAAIPEQARAGLASAVSLGRPGTVQEAASAIGFLCSPWSDYVTGQVLNVNGGIQFGMAA
ncbi:SDR family NAD(P)-dependent oxidoreductase [Conexibacter arvalis]|uniref:3-oxoacyl-[acyl-carrier protein] reductase n=1 Tax=Conexibacter arvalis TaxID=912552 RepID=A0A840I677_9ACTN|nr:SDR family oxidoreductase [Conexibacter arvalis]MBB4660436.1 3-oxoacyl-[acyl-carrier protein] reductase [Conexibacter arvalis]